MPKKSSKTNGTKERASVSRERKLALALRAVLDTMSAQDANGGLSEEGYAAEAVLTELGYGSLEGIPSRMAKLNAQLKDAVEAGDGALISKLGLELERAKQGKSSLLKEPRKPRQSPSARTAGEKSAPKSRGSSSTANSGIEKDAVLNVTTEGDGNE